MSAFASWFLIVVGVLGALLGVTLILILRRFAQWQDPDARELWRGMGWHHVDPAIMRTPEAREAMEHLWRHDPSLAAETTDAWRQYEELGEREDDAFADVGRLARWVVRLGYVAWVLVVGGCIAVSTGILSRHP